MSRGFTLVEVVVALILLEIGVLAAAGTLVLASRALGRAERIERAVAALELVADSIGAAGSGADGARPFPGGRVLWGWRGAGGLADLVAVDVAGDTLAEVVLVGEAP